MQHTLIMGVVVALLAGGTATGVHAQSAVAPATKSAEAKAAEDKHRSEDIAKHRQMARAHEEAVRCLESGEKETVCQERLRAACSGIAVGRYCGMRHAH
jgi:hypothetical protein